MTMLTQLNSQNLSRIQNSDFRKYAAMYSEIRENYFQQIKSIGIELETETDPEEQSSKLESLRQQGAVFRNQDKSIYVNWISPACEACKKGQGSITLYLSLMCHRNCYYCFNSNQQDYEYYSTTKKDCLSQLEAVSKSGQKITHLALTGGEPLLHKKELIEFFTYARNTFGNAHLRLYTSGDLLDIDTLSQLRNCGLNEIRFSIKMEDETEVRNKLLAHMALAKEYIPEVMVEMPVIPGNQDEMKNLLLELEKIKISGINLLEFCFPFHNADEYRKRGYKIKNPPFQVLYNYWYAGGLPISESQSDCLELLNFTLEKELKLGVHYCSLENKHTGQIFQQNHQHKAWPNVYFSQRDYFLKTAKVFGDDIPKVQKFFKKKNIACVWDKQNGFLDFNIKDIKHLKGLDIEIGISSNIIEEREDGKYLRELKIDLLATDLASVQPNMF